MLEAIVAVGRGGVIGNKGELPWPRLPADMRHFRYLTEGHAVLMGRKTAESLRGPLKNRLNFVVSRDPRWRHANDPERRFRVKPVDGLLPLARYTCILHVIGGAEIYRLYAPFVDTLHVTVVHGDFGGDTFFPADAFAGEWETVSEVFRPADDENAYGMTFATFRRKS